MGFLEEKAFRAEGMATVNAQRPNVSGFEGVFLLIRREKESQRG